MGNCVTKSQKNNFNNNCSKIPIAIPIIEKDIEINILPYDPSEDLYGKYKWVIIHSSHSEEILNKQNEGFILTMKENKSSGYFWLRKIR